jgi:hypothetical protein
VASASPEVGSSAFGAAGVDSVAGSVEAVTGGVDPAANAAARAAAAFCAAMAEGWKGRWWTRANHQYRPQTTYEGNSRK